ncbi:MAG TPA: GYD domain-containing protein [Coriobacteriia bacterium]|nr:GYD domain-containing protein [Coriobacteriia bacterium]
MPVYVMLTRLTEQGAATIKSKPERILEVDSQLGEMGLKVMQQYAVLGRYDFVNIVEAPDNATVARIALELASRGSIHIETLAAMPVEDLIGTLKG